MIELRNLSGGYNGECQLASISLAIPSRSITTIIGPNGCGKSTLLRIISGLHKPYTGEIFLDGTPQRAMNAHTLAQTVSFLPQARNPASIPVESLVLHGRFPYMGYPRHYRAEDREAARKSMEWAGVSHLSKRSVATLSGGERQKVYIAMLLAQGTPIVLMDEPTCYLDISHKFDVIHLARQMKQTGKTVVMVLHELDLALEYSDQVILMDKGRVRACGPPSEIYRSGMMEEVFRVRAGQIETKDGTAYYFRPL